MWQQLLSLVLLFCLWFLYRAKISSKLPPGPTPFPIIGNIFNIKGNPRQAFKDLAGKFGPVFGIYVGSQYAVVVSGINEVLEIFQKKSTRTADRYTPWVIKRSTKDELSVGFHDYDGFWRAQRKLLHHNMLNPSQLNQFEPLILTEMDFLVKTVELEGEKPFDIGPLLRRTSMSIIATLIAGKRFEVTDPNFLKLEEIIKQRTQSSFTPMDIFPFLKFLPIKWFYNAEKIDQQTDFMRSFFGKILEEHRSTLDPENARDFIDVILINKNNEEFRDEKSNPLGDNNIINLFFGLFIAGTDTTATTLQWMVIALCKDPSIQEKMQKEIDQVLMGRKATFEDKPKMNYVNAVIKETMRWRSVTPFSLPHKNREDLQVGETTIPAGSILLPNIWAVHMDEKVWGNPEEFNPERWLTGTDLDKNLIPFGVGIRECAGKNLAHRNVFLETVYLFQNFVFSAKENLSTDGIHGITYSPIPFKIFATKRNKFFNS